MRHKVGVPYRLPSGRWVVFLKCEDGETRRFATYEHRPLRRPVRTRFDVLAQDNYTCQYCGEKAPDVVLHVDHRVPVAEGGTDDPSNLVTACKDCNEGKGPRHSDGVFAPRPDLDATSWERKVEAMRKMGEMFAKG